MEKSRFICQGGADGAYAQIIFRSDFYASALHEIAHWCLARAARRKLVDFGYWYNPDGRTAEEQILFEQVEVKPQALEWIFSLAAGIKFRISADNVANNNEVTFQFKQLVYQQVKNYLDTGLPPRAELFKNSLLNFYSRAHLFSKASFHINDL